MCRWKASSILFGRLLTQSEADDDGECSNKTVQISITTHKTTPTRTRTDKLEVYKAATKQSVFKKKKISPTQRKSHVRMRCCAYNGLRPISCVAYGKYWQIYRELRERVRKRDRRGEREITIKRDRINITKGDTDTIFPFIYIYFEKNSKKNMYNTSVSHDVISLLSLMSAYAKFGVPLMDYQKLNFRAARETKRDRDNSGVEREKERNRKRK